MLESPKNIQKNKIDDNCYIVDDDNDSDSIVFSPEKKCSSNQFYVSIVFEIILLSKFNKIIY